MPTAIRTPPNAAHAQQHHAAAPHAGTEHDDPPALSTASRVLSAIAGVAAAAAMLFVGGLYAIFTTCEAASGQQICGALGSLVTALELAAVLGGAGAALVGGIGAAVTARGRWIGYGLAVFLSLALLLAVLVGFQHPVSLS